MNCEFLSINACKNILKSYIKQKKVLLCQQDFFSQPALDKDPDSFGYVGRLTPTGKSCKFMLA